MYDTFLLHVQQLYDNNFPLQDAKCRYDKCKSPWLSDGIYNSIRRKNNVYSKYLRNPTANNKSIYTLYKNKLNYLIKTAKKNYQYTKFYEVKGNIKGTWKVINYLLNRRKQNINTSYFFQDGNEINDNKEIAEAFNNYFVNIGSSLFSQLPLCNTSLILIHFWATNVQNSICFIPITQEEVVDCINKIPSGKAPGSVGLSSSVIKQARYSLAKPLADIFNKCLTAGVFPDSLKIAQVTPIYKKWL